MDIKRNYENNVLVKNTTVRYLLVVMPAEKKNTLSIRSWHIFKMLDTVLKPAKFVNFTITGRTGCPLFFYKSKYARQNIISYSWGR